jgi:hypothetical protein
MIHVAYNNGRTAALARFKVAQGIGSVGATPAPNPALGGQATAGSSPALPTAGAAPTSAAPPIAAGANKARALG